MLNTIEEKLSAIKAINEQKDKIDNIIQRIELNPQLLQVSIANINLLELMPGIKNTIFTLLNNELEEQRTSLIEQAKQLMK